MIRENQILAWRFFRRKVVSQMRSDCYIRQNYSGKKSKLADRRFQGEAMERGFLIIAQNSKNVNYINHAKLLARSLHASQSDHVGVSIIVDDDSSGEFDEFESVIVVPSDDSIGESWKIHNKWQIGELSPYQKTIWFDADVLVTVDLAEWWSRLNGTPIRFCTQPIDYRENLILRHVYRQNWEGLNLPMVYTGMTYFERSTDAFRIFDKAKCIFHGWADLCEKFNMNCSVSGDLAFAFAVHLLEAYQSVPEVDDYFKLIHMKPMAFTSETSKFVGKRWSDILPLSVKGNEVWIDGYLQRYPFHYVEKTMVDTFSKFF